MPARLTIGITAYREGEWLRECWESVLAQTCQDWEAIIVLDGGADAATEKVFDELVHPQLTKIKCPKNIGPYPARELIFAQSNHDIILHSDADDYFLPNAAKATLRLYKDDSVRWIALGGRFVYEDGTSRDYPERTMGIEDLLMECKFPGYLLFRRSVWLELGKYDAELKRGHADVDICLKILKLGMRGEVTREVCHVKRERKASVSSSSTYIAQLDRFHERIVHNNPEVFVNEELRRKFLAQGYLFATWNLVGLGRFEEAGGAARKYVALRGPRDVWPINWAGPMPVALVSLLLKARLGAGKFARALAGKNRVAKAG